MYSSIKECVEDLERSGQVLRIKSEADPYLQMPTLHRRVFAKGGPALYFEKVKGSEFPAVSNLFGTLDRARYIFRRELPLLQLLFLAKADPKYILKHWKSWPQLAWRARCALPQKTRKVPVMEREVLASQLPAVHSWPMDGGRYITLPQVYSENPGNPGWMRSNLGMYRVQIDGNDFIPEKEMGLHYQIHRGIGIHHARSKELGQPLKVSVFVGGPPAHTLAAVMPLPDAIAEVLFAGVLAGSRFRYTRWNSWMVSAEADFCVLGTVQGDEQKLEGPFGDHLGYYSLKHNFPLLHVEKIFARKDAVWPFTVVGRPPQEDTIFGELIHEWTGDLIPKEIPGVHQVHAVDASGVHPLLLAIGSERYTPYQERVRPMELLTLSNKILGFGQLSLAKYLIIAAKEDDYKLNATDIPGFFTHILARIDLTRDLHFQTQTTIDTLDYSGEGFNKGSKLVMAACGKPIRELGTNLEFLSNLNLPSEYGEVALLFPGALGVKFPPFINYEDASKQMQAFSKVWAQIPVAIRNQFPLVIATQTPYWMSKHLNNFLWQVFTRSNPSHDVYGLNEAISFKHWACEAPMIIDARPKPHHAPDLAETDQMQSSLEALAAKEPLLKPYLQ
jgi:4-hydroxy-3-polyprenylbenzoate decarboxylase